MEKGKPSRTALRVATERAAHQLLDHPKILDDPLALEILGKERAEALRANPRSAETSVISRYLRAFVAVRSRLAEDLLARAVEQGVKQYVVLGAGLDTFALRNPHPAEVLKVFEVDFPATQAWKWEHMAGAGLSAPSSLTYVPCDFHEQTLAQSLARAGLDASKPSFFSWLGVVPYLTSEAVMATLSYIASLPNGSGVVFDYMIDTEGMGLRERMVRKGIGAFTKASGEPLHSCFRPAVLADELAALGFSHTRDLDQAAMNGLYFADREDGLGVGSMSHIMVAFV